MSFRTRRGRYPKGSALSQPSSTQMSHQPVTGGVNYSHASEVPFYNVQQTAQIAQHTPYSGDPALQHHSIIAAQPPAHQPLASVNRFQPQPQMEYWHENSSYANPENSAWDWTPHTVAESTSNQQSSVATPPNVLQSRYFQPKIAPNQYQDPTVLQQQALPLQQQVPPVQSLTQQQLPQQKQHITQVPQQQIPQQQQQIPQQQYIPIQHAPPQQQHAPPQQQHAVQQQQHVPEQQQHVSQQQSHQHVSQQQPLLQQQHVPEQQQHVSQQQQHVPEQQQHVSQQQPQQHVSQQQPILQQQTLPQQQLPQEQPLSHPPPPPQQQLNYVQPMNNVYNNDSHNYLSESFSVDASSANYPPQSKLYPPNSTDQNYEQSLPEMQQLASWEPTIPNISQAEQIQWTYNVPQNTVPLQSQWQNPGITTNCVSVNSTTWSHQTTHNWNQTENHQNNNSVPQQPLDCELNNIPVSESDKFENAQYHSYQNNNNVENFQVNSSSSLNSSFASGINNIPENLLLEDSESGTVSTFFGNSLEENAPASNEQSPAQVPHVDALDVRQIEDQMADLSIVQRHTPTISELNDCNSSHHSAENISPSHNSFLQKEIDSEQPEVLSFLPSSTEEPLNQEVPEPTDSSCISSVLQDVSNQVSEEPLNQEIPAKAVSRPGEGKKPTPERIPDLSAIGHKEGSPFKPPTKLKDSTGPVVQQESSEADIALEFASKGDIGIQDVNLETLPDNLERPFDQDRPQRQWHSSRLRRYLCEGEDEKLSALDTSSTSLLDSPDIPCITLALAAPMSPSHSHRGKSSTPPVTDASDHEDSQTNTPVAANSANIVNEEISNTPSHEKSSFSPMINESPTTPVPQPSLVTPQPILLPVLINNQTNSPNVSTSDHSFNTSSNTEQNKEQDRERKSDSRRNSFKASSPIKELKTFEPTPSDKHNHERDVQSYSRNYSERDANHFQHSREESNRRHYRDYDNHGPPSRDPRDRNAQQSRQHFAENRYPVSYDEHAYSDRDGSRPSSRMSLNETGSHGTYRDDGYRKPYASDYERPPSRLSESEAYGPNKRRSHHYDRDSQYYREEEYYRRARHYGEYNYDPYQTAANPYHPYYYPYGGYNNFNYGFYDELCRGDSRYKQQVVDQYREYYRRLGYETDPDRLSVHSGRSSANELARDMRYQEPDGHSNESDYSSYAQQVDTYSEDQHSTPSTRLTPAKFSCPHPIARFSNNGWLITLLPKSYSSEQSAFVEIHDVQALAQGLDSYEELKNYDGPLIRGGTHKNDVIDFCLRKIKFYKRKDGIPDRESYVLLWELLVLLLRQNGSVAGSDIAELLLKNHEILYRTNKVAEDPSQGVPSPTDGGEHSVNAQTGDNSSPDEGIVVARDRTILNAAQSFDPDKLIQKYREFLLFGHKKDAIEYAVKHGLWSHALFLASKMDMRTYSSVLMRFTNSLALNDPLQSLYQLMSGRQPTAVTCIADKQWGDWRPHLAMILSNPSSNPENDSKSITTLGDTLAAQGCLPAAHFCYLMAQVEFSYYNSKGSKMVLLGANHLLPFETFASNEAIQCTEIYEYAQSLANPGFVLNHLQTYKFLYATRLIDHGFFPEALRYCEVLASSFVSSPYSVSLSLITQIYELANKLKYHDPYYLPDSLEPHEDPEWLQLFSTTLQNVQNNIPYQSDSEEAPSDGTANAENFKEENDSAHELSNTDIQNQNYYSNESQQNYYNQENQNLYVNHNSWTGENHSVQNSQLNTYDNQTTQPNYNQYSNNTQPTQWNLNSQQHISEQYQGNESIESATDVSPLSTALPPQPSPPSLTNNKFDFHGTSNQQVYRERTNSVSSFTYQKDRHDSNISSGSDHGTGTHFTVKRKSSENRVIASKEDKSRQQVGRSWLGGIFNRLLPKAPNQMILPDDKNPAIVWDPVKKAWLNTEGDEYEDNLQPVAPPKDTELLNQTNLSEVPSPMPSLSSPPSSISNRFKRVKGKGVRDYIDVLNPTSPATKASALPAALFPSPLPSQVQTPQLFIPTGPVSEDQPMDFVSTGQAYISPSQVEDEDSTNVPDAPVMYDPAEFDTRKSSVNSLRHSVGPARRAYPT